MYIAADTLDDLLHQSIEKVIKRGSRLANNRRGANRELCGVLLRLNNPLARLSHTERRGKIFSALGELAWYLAGDNTGEFVTYYIKRYEKELESDGTINGAYGPRLFGQKGRQASQFDRVIRLLRERPDTRQAVMQVFDARDLSRKVNDVPCTCTLQFMIRSNQLNLFVTMRSNDAYLGLPHDVFSFTMLQEIVARTLGCDLGQYSHYAGSFHIYDENLEAARRYLDEGWQDQESAAMPGMPAGDPWPSIRDWLAAEAAIRAGRQPRKQILSGLDDYWLDLLRLLQAFRYSKSDDFEKVKAISRLMKSRVYKEYLAQKAKPKATVPKSGQPTLFDLEAEESDVDRT